MSYYSVSPNFGVRLTSNSTTAIAEVCTQHFDPSTAEPYLVCGWFGSCGTNYRYSDLANATINRNITDPRLQLLSSEELYNQTRNWTSGWYCRRDTFFFTTANTPGGPLNNQKVTYSIPVFTTTSLGSPGYQFATDTVTLVINGSVPNMPACVATPSPLDFGQGLEGTTVNATLQICNPDGNIDLVINSHSISLNTLDGFNPAPDSFVVDIPDGTTIPIGSCQTFDAHFNPQVINVTNSDGSISKHLGYITGSLILNTNSSSSIPGIPLSGEVLGIPDINLLQTTVEFGDSYLNQPSDPQSIRIFNYGSANLEILSMEFSGPDAGDFSLVPDLTGSAVPYEHDDASGNHILGQRDFGIVVTPSHAGDINGVLTITTNDPDEPTVTISLHSTAYDGPKLSFALDEINFGTVRVGETKSLPVHICNIGSQPLNLMQEIYEAKRYETQSWSGCWSWPCPPHINCNYYWALISASSTYFTYIDNLNAGPSNSILAPGECLDSQITITPTGTLSYTPNYVSLSLNCPADFSSVCTGSTSWSNKHCEDSSIHWYKLVLRSNDMQNTDKQLNVLATILNEPKIVLNPSADLQFGGINYGESKTLPLQICNEAQVPLDISSINITGPDAALFSVDQTSFSNIAQGQCVNLNVTFSVSDPTSQPRHALLTLTHNDSQNNPSEINLSGYSMNNLGSGTNSTIEVDFGVVKNATSASKTMQLCAGESGIVFDSFILVNGDTTFTYDDLTGQTIPANNCQDFTVNYNPIVPLEQNSDTLQVKYHFETDPTIVNRADLILTGESGASKAALHSPTSNSFGIWFVDYGCYSDGGQRDRKITVCNEGNMGFNVTSIDLGPETYMGWPFYYNKNEHRLWSLDAGTCAAGTLIAPGDCCNATISFPKNDGTGITVFNHKLEGANVNITTNADINPSLSAEYTGTARYSPILQSVGSIDFGTIYEFEHPSQTINIHNDYSKRGIKVNYGNSSSLYVNADSISGPAPAPTYDGSTTVTATIEGANANEFSVDQQTFTINANGDYSVNVTITPSGMGTKSAELVLTADTGCNHDFQKLNEIRIPLSANVVPVPDIYLESNTVDFGDVFEHYSKTLTFSVCNSGGGILHISQYEINGTDSSLFTVQNPAPTVNPNDCSPIQIKFAPDSTGTKQATLFIHSDDWDEPIVNATLTGNGVLVPDIDVTPSYVNFGMVLITFDANATVDVCNTGNATLTDVTVSLTGDGAGAYSYSPALNGASLAPNACESLTVFFVPTSSGEFNATIEITSNDPDPVENPAIIKITGQAKNIPDIDGPHTVNFGDVFVDETKTVPFDLCNVGDGALEITNVEFTGPNVSEISWTPFFSTRTIPPQSCETINATLAPLTETDKQATITFYSDDPDESPFSIDLIGRGRLKPDIEVNATLIDFGTQFITLSTEKILKVSNIGSGTLDIGKVEIVGPDKASFMFTHDLSNTFIGPGGENYINVFFRPLNPVGIKNADLVIHSNDPQDPDLIVSLTGEAKIGPDISIIPQTLTFPDTEIGSVSNQTLTICNNGDYPLTVNNVFLSGSTDFSFDSSIVNQVIPENGGCVDMNVSFAPTQNYADKATAQLQFQSDDPNEPYIYISLEGTVPGAPAIKIQPGFTVDFGSVLVGTSKTMDLTISNDGRADLVVSNNAFTVNQNVFSATPDLSANPIAGGASINLSFTYSPTDETVNSATYQFETNDPQYPLITINLRGIGVQSPEIDVQPLFIDFGPVAVGETVTRNFSICNLGAEDLNVTAITLPNVNGLYTVPDVTGIQDSNGTTIQPGSDNCMLVNVFWKPTTEITLNNAIKIYSNDPDENVVAINIRGFSYMDINPAMFWFTVLDNGEGVKIVCHAADKCEGIVAFEMGPKEFEDFGVNVTRYANEVKDQLKLGMAPCYSVTQSGYSIYGIGNQDTCNATTLHPELSHNCYFEAHVDPDSINGVPETNYKLTGNLIFTISGVQNVKDCTEFSLQDENGTTLVDNQHLSMSTNLFLEDGTGNTTDIYPVNIYTVYQATDVTTPSDLAAYHAKIKVDHVTGGDHLFFKLYFRNMKNEEVLLPANLTVQKTLWTIDQTIMKSGMGLQPDFDSVFSDQVVTVRAEVYVSFNAKEYVFKSNELEIGAPLNSCGPDMSPACIKIPEPLRPQGAPDRPIYSEYFDETAEFGSALIGGYFGDNATLNPPWYTTWQNDNNYRLGWLTYTVTQAKPWEMYWLCPESAYHRPDGLDPALYYDACVDPDTLSCPPPRTNVDEWFATWSTDGWWCMQHPCSLVSIPTGGIDIECRE